MPVLVTAEVDAAALEAGDLNRLQVCIDSFFGLLFHFVFPDADQSLNESKIDYEFAQREVMLNQVGGNFHTAIPLSHCFD